MVQNYAYNVRYQTKAKLKILFSNEYNDRNHLFTQYNTVQQSVKRKLKRILGELSIDHYAQEMYLKRTTWKGNKPNSS